MFSRSAIIVLALLLVAASGWVVFSLEKAVQPTPDPMLSLPNDVMFVWQIQAGHHPDFGQEARALAGILDPQFDEFSKMLENVDSLRQQNSFFQDLMINSSLVLSLHNTEPEPTWVISAAYDDVLDAQLGNFDISNRLSIGSSERVLTNFNGFPLVGFDGIGQLTLGTTPLPHSESLLKQDSVFAKCYSAASSSGSNLFLKRPSGWVLGELEVEQGAINMHLVDFQNVSETFFPNIESNADEIIPASTSNFRSQYIEQTAHFNATLSDIEDSCACDITAFFVNEVSHSTSFRFKEHDACALHYPALLDRLNSFSQLVGPTIEQEYGYPIFRFLHPDFFEAIGQSDKLVWLTYTHDHLVALPTRQALSDYLAVLSTGKVRANEAGTAAINSSLPVGYVSETHVDPDDWFPLSFESGVLRTYPSSPSGSYFALSIATQDQATTPNETDGPQWAAPCDGLSRGPWLVKNHYTGEGEVLWQDNSNSLHLLSSTGTKLWSATVDGQVFGDVSQIDIFKNGKLQLIFNTPSSIYCLDRKGRLVDNFPIRLPSQATCPVAIVDYDSDSDYRLIQGVAGGDILNYKVDGKSTSGWNFRKSGSDIKHLEHIRIRAKDYVFGLEESGEIHLLKRGGGSRYKSKAQARHHRSEDIYFVKGSTIGTTKMIYPDDSGNIVSLQFDQDVTEYGLTGLSSGSNLTLADINDDRALDFIVADGNEVMAFDSDFNRLFSTELPSPITFGPKVFSFSKTDKKIGAVSENQMYLIDNKGNITTGFPKPGQDGFLIYDLDRNGSMEVVGALNGAMISTGL